MQKKGKQLAPIRIQMGPDEKVLKLKTFGFEPLVRYPGSDKSWLCRCEQGHEV